MNDKTADADRIMAGWQETIREVEANKDGFVEIPRKRIVTTPTQAMTEITQADRDAANEAQRNAIMRVGSMHDAFARHREQAAAEERAKIVAWLRGFATDKTDELADILEAGEPFTHPDNV